MILIAMHTGAQVASALSYLAALVIAAEAVYVIAVCQQILGAVAEPESGAHLDLRLEVYRMRLDDLRHRQVASVGLLVGTALLVALMLNFEPTGDDPEIVIVALAVAVGVVVATHRLIVTARSLRTMHTIERKAGEP